MFILTTSMIEESLAQGYRVNISEELIVELGKGDMNAMQVLYESTNKAVYGFAYSILKNPQDAQDVLQDTFVQIYTYAPNYSCQGKPMAWILRIARNLALMKIRDQKKTEPIEMEDKVESMGGEEFTLQIENKMILDIVLHQLEDESRQILILHAVSGLKHREIAEVMNLKLSTVLSKYRRTIKKLKSILQEVGYYE